MQCKQKNCTNLLPNDDYKTCKECRAKLRVKNRISRKLKKIKGRNVPDERLFKKECWFCHTEPHKEEIHDVIVQFSEIHDSDYHWISCCSVCSRMKGYFSDDEYIQKCKNVAECHD